MQSFSYGDPSAIEAAIKACHKLPAHPGYDATLDQGKYAMCLNPTDLATVLEALAYYAESDGVVMAQDDNAASLYSGILQTLEIEVI